MLEKYEEWIEEWFKNDPDSKNKSSANSYHYVIMPIRSSTVVSTTIFASKNSNFAAQIEIISAPSVIPVLLIKKKFVAGMENAVGPEIEKEKENVNVKKTSKAPNVKTVMK